MLRDSVPSSTTIAFEFVIMVFALASWSVTVDASESEWAYPGATGRLIYDSTAIGDRIPNFSNVGYRYGNESIPVAPQAILLQPGVGDDTQLIQNAIDTVEALPVGPTGFRGAVVLGPGEFQVNGSLNIRASGVVLRGSGNSNSGTVLRATGTARRTLIEVEAFSSRVKDFASERTIADKYVPVGATSFMVDDASGFAVGDEVIVFRPSTANWISDLGMDMIPPRPDGMPITQWTPGSKNLLSDRVVTRIEGNRVFVNAPLTNSLDAQYGGGTIYKYTFPNRLENIGIEHIKSISDFDGTPDDEDHAWTFVEMDDTQHGWVRDVSAQHYGYSTVSIGRDAKNISVVNSQFLDPVSQITGSRRYSFEIEGQLNIVRDSTADSGRHDFVLNSPSPGPNVFFNNSATNAQSDTGPHQRWSTGTLFDNISVQGDNINIRNRGYFGTGHGWAGANMVVWNSAADGFIVQNPPTAQNWVIGSVGDIVEDTRFGPQPPGIFDHHGTPVGTTSLYLQQLADRMSIANSEMREYTVGDYDLMVNDGAGSVDMPPVSNNLLRRI